MYYLSSYRDDQIGEVPFGLPDTNAPNHSTMYAS